MLASNVSIHWLVLCDYVPYKLTIDFVDGVVLMITAEAPSFIRSPPPTVKLAETQSTSLPCNVVGTPTPDIAWKTGSPPGRFFPLFHDEDDAERFIVNATGDLLIQVARQKKL